MGTLDLSLDIVDGVGGFHLEGDGFTRQGFDEDLHRGLCMELDQHLLITKTPVTSTELVVEQGSYLDRVVVLNLLQMLSIPMES